MKKNINYFTIIMCLMILLTILNAVFWDSLITTTKTAICFSIIGFCFGFMFRDYPTIQNELKRSKR